MITTAPCVMGMHSLVQPMRCFAVRMKEFNEQNIHDDGTMLWPEVVICSTKDQADRLCDYLNAESFKEDWETWHEEEPNLSEGEARQRWLEQDFAIYVIEDVPALNKYEHLYRISQSLDACSDLFDELNYV